MIHVGGGWVYACISRDCCGWVGKGGQILMTHLLNGPSAIIDWREKKNSYKIVILGIYLDRNCPGGKSVFA